MRSLPMSWTFLLASAVLSWGVPSHPASAAEILDDPAHFTELAANTIRTANALCWELHRFHQQQPEFPMLYRDAKEIWSQAGALQNALQAGPVDSAVANQNIARMTTLLGGIEKGIAKWGDGVRPTPADVVERRGVVVTPRGGVGIDVPFFGLRLAAPRIAVAEEVVVPTPLNRRAIHANGRGSRRSLDREVFALKTALGYLAEDVSVPAIPPGPTPVPLNADPTPAAADVIPLAPRPQPQIQQPVLPDSSSSQQEGTVLKVLPSSVKKPDAPAVNK